MIDHTAASLEASYEFYFGAMKKPMLWVSLDPSFPLPEGLGLLPDILSAADGRSVREQLEDRYRHGGGWRPIQGFRMQKNRTLRFPGDPPYRPAAAADVNGELVIFYKQASLLAVIQQDGKWEVTRVD
jgi:hypothetical protein